MSPCSNRNCYLRIVLAGSGVISSEFGITTSAREANRRTVWPVGEELRSICWFLHANAQQTELIKPVHVLPCFGSIAFPCSKYRCRTSTLSQL